MEKLITNCPTLKNLPCQPHKNAGEFCPDKLTPSLSRSEDRWSQFGQNKKLNGVGREVEK